MLTKTPSWTTTDGKVHTNYSVALKHELTTMFAKHADSDVIAKKLVESMTPPFIDAAIEIMQLIKAEMTNPSEFEVRLLDKPPVTGIEDELKNESLGTVGEAAKDLNENVLDLGTGQVINNVSQADECYNTDLQNVDQGNPSDAAKTFVDPGFAEAQRAAA